MLCAAATTLEAAARAVVCIGVGQARDNGYDIQEQVYHQHRENVLSVVKCVFTTQVSGVALLRSALVGNAAAMAGRWGRGSWGGAARVRRVKY